MMKSAPVTVRPVGKRGGPTVGAWGCAAIAFAEWLSITYGDAGVRVSCICPMGVATNMLSAGVDSDDQLTATGAAAVISAGAVLEPADVAAAVMQGIADEQLLILPHRDLLRMFWQKASDYERWLRGMRLYQASLLESSLDRHH